MNLFYNIFIESVDLIEGILFDVDYQDVRRDSSKYVLS